MPPKDLLEPQLSTIGPIIEGIKYQEEDSILYEMFSNLLTASINKNNVSDAHPAFANIIRQLSPDEAVIIFYLSKQHFKLKEQSNYNATTNLFTDSKIILNEFPIQNLINADKFILYMNHLNSLGVAGIWQNGNQEIIRENGKQTGVYINNLTKLTDFGKLFAKVCVPADINNFSDIKHSK